MSADHRIDAELSIVFKASGFDEGGTSEIPFSWKFTQVKQSDVVRVQSKVKDIVNQLMDTFEGLAQEKSGHS